MKRTEERRRRKHSKARKFLAGMLFLMIIIGSGMQVSFADQDINGLLTGWFKEKKVDAMEEIDEAIAIEQQKQTERLKEALRLEIESAEVKLQTIVDTEKSVRVAEIKNYADELISDMGVNNGELKDEKIGELERIIEEAKAEMNKVLQDETTGSEE